MCMSGQGFGLELNVSGGPERGRGPVTCWGPKDISELMSVVALVTVTSSPE